MRIGGSVGAGGRVARKFLEGIRRVFVSASTGKTGKSGGDKAYNHSNFGRHLVYYLLRLNAVDALAAIASTDGQRTENATRLPVALEW